MNRATTYTPSDPVESHSLVVQFLVGLAFVLAVLVVLWVLADPAAALLTLTAVVAAGLLAVGVLEQPDDDGERNA